MSSDMAPALSPSVGMLLPNQKACTRYIQDIALSQGKRAKLQNGGGAHLVYECTSATPCTFRVAFTRSRKQDTKGFQLSSYVLEHRNCTGKPQIDKSQARLMRSVVFAAPRVGAKIIQRQLVDVGVTVSARMAYRARRSDRRHDGKLCNGVSRTHVSPPQVASAVRRRITKSSGMPLSTSSARSYSIRTHFDAFDACYTLDALRLCYGGVCAGIEQVLTEELEMGSLKPPVPNKPASGRPKTRRIQSQGEEVRSGRFCGLCNETGHERRTCSQRQSGHQAIPYGKEQCARPQATIQAKKLHKRKQTSK